MRGVERRYLSVEVVSPFLKDLSFIYLWFVISFRDSSVYGWGYRICKTCWWICPEGEKTSVLGLRAPFLREILLEHHVSWSYRLKMSCFEVWSCRWLEKISRLILELQACPNPNPDVIHAFASALRCRPFRSLAIGLSGAPTSPTIHLRNHVSTTTCTAIMA